MKDTILKWLDEHKKETIALGEELFIHPELGFKEFETKKIIQRYLDKYGLKIEKEYFETGFQVTLGSGKPHIGLICELDAIPTPNHPCEGNDNHAAHSCAHSTQVAIMCSVLAALSQHELKGTVTCFFTPAEEFCDLDYRRKLRDEGKLMTLSGKTNMLLAHVFDDCDCFIHMHGMGEYNGYRFSIGSTLAGFTYKKLTFVGKASHAAVCPDQGLNALNMFTLFQSAVAMLRETFVDEDKNRIHGIVTHGGDTVNSIPASVVYECYVRTFNTEKLQSLNEQLTHTAMHCAQALNGTCIVEDEPGYLPFHQSKALNKVIESNARMFSDEIKHDEKSVAAGDVGDLGCFKPVIQFGYVGFKGVMHGKDLMITEPETVYVEPAKIVAGSVVDMLLDPALVDEIKAEFKPSMTMENYKKYLGIKDC